MKEPAIQASSASTSHKISAGKSRPSRCSASLNPPLRSTISKIRTSAPASASPYTPASAPTPVSASASASGTTSIPDNRNTHAIVYQILQ